MTAIVQPLPCITASATQCYMIYYVLFDQRVTDTAVTQWRTLHACIKAKSGYFDAHSLS